METKVCNKCGQELPATEEYFYKHPFGKGGLNAQCKECVKARVPKRPLSNKFVDNGDGTTSMYFVNRDKSVDSENVVIIDTADVEYVSKCVWVYHNNAVYTNVKNGKNILLKKYLLGETDKIIVFLNKNHFDFRRANLAMGWEGRKQHIHNGFVKRQEFYAKRKAKQEIAKILKGYFRRTAKVCPTCGKLLPLNDSYWYKNKSTKDGFSGECIECELTRKRDALGYLPRKFENDYIHLGNGDTLIVLENRNRKIVGYARIDTIMYEACKSHKWHINGKSRRRDGHTGNTDYVSDSNGLPLHRFVLGEPPEGYTVDHINRDGLDNRISNLRFATFSQNNMNKGIQRNNTSGCTGVEWKKSEQKWRARIKVNYQNIELGYFKKKSDAIKARKEAEIKYFGEFRDKISETAVV